MTKLELTSSWPTVVRMAGEGASLREIAEEVSATPGAINTALKRMGIEKAPAPPGPRARRGAAPPPPKEPKVKGERQPRQKAATAGEKRKPGRPRNKTFPEVIGGVLEEFGFDSENLNDPATVGETLRSVFRSLGLTPKDNLSDDNTDDCDENAESDDVSSVPVDADSSGEDDNGDCDGEANTDEVEDDPGFAMTDDFIGAVPSGNGPEWGEEIVELADDSSVQTPDAVDPNEQTLRGEIIDDWGTPPGFTIPDDETLSTMNRDDLRKLAANPAVKEWKYMKGYSKMSADDLRKALSQVRNDSV